jgi:hypothetical protein
MYKRQFAKWNFYKYAVKKRLKEGDSRPIPVKSPTKASSNGTEVTTTSPKSPVLYQNDQSRAMYAGLTAVRHYLLGFIDMDPVNCKADVVFEFDDPIYRYFRTATDLLDSQETIAGGRVLRLAFLQIERKIARPNIKSFSDLCFLVPHLLIEANRPDILSAYFNYVSHLARVKLGNHPFTNVVESFSELQPEEIMRYIMALSQVNADTVSNVQGMLERTRVWAQNQSYACQRTILPADNLNDGISNNGSAAGSPAVTDSRPGHDHPMIRLEAQSVYWAQHLLVSSPESDDLGRQWLRRNFAPDFAPRCEAMLAVVKERIDSGRFPSVFARMIECLYTGWLYDYFETNQDWPRVFQWGRRGLSLATDEQVIVWSIHLEQLMREHGDPAEADQIHKLRTEHDWLEKVRLQVDDLSIS